MTRQRPISRRLASVAVALAAIALAGQAQALERNPPPQAGTGAAALPLPNVTAGDNDTTPLGPKLTRVVLIGIKDPVSLSGDGADVDATRVPQLDNGAFVAAVQPFIGQPISRHLIGEIEATIGEFQRAAGYPFVSISTPPQEISDGVIRFRVIEFRTDTITVAGNKREDTNAISSRVRLAPGDRVYAPTLSADLDWLNRSPFRQVTAQFSPSATVGLTDLQLNAVEKKPWNIFAGYSNTGSVISPNRYFVGGTLGDFAGINSVLSMQVTGSPNFWSSGGWPFGSKLSADYGSGAIVADLPLAARSGLEITADAVGQNGPDSALVDSTQMIEGSGRLITSLSNVAGSLPGDVSIGIEARHEERTRYFGTTAINDDTQSIYQLALGWQWAWNGSQSGNVDAALHVSPGGLGSDNTGAAFATYSTGRVTSASYSYVTVDATSQATVGGGFALAQKFEGQVSSGPLPDSEQAALGGMEAVRGYVADDGSYDSLAVLRNEVLLPGMTASGPQSVAAVPFAFVDLGAGENMGGGATYAASAGIGGRVSTALVKGELSIAHAFVAAPTTTADSWSTSFRVVATY